MELNIPRRRNHSQKKTFLKKAAQRKKLLLRIFRNKRKQKNIHTEFRYGNYDIQNKSKFV